MSDCARQGYHYPYERWISLLPNLLTAYLEHLLESIGTPVHLNQPFQHYHCSSVQCTGTKTAKILCLFLDHEFHLHFHAVCLTNADYDEKSVPYCACHLLPTVLICHSLFPSAPHQPRIAFALTLLNFYQSLFEHVCDAINALASALHSSYERQGFYLRNQQGLPALNPFHCSLSCTVQWYDCLLVRAEDQADKVLEECLGLAQSSSMTVDDMQAPTTSLSQHSSSALPPSTSSSSSKSVEETLTPGTCYQILQDLCPACFGGSEFGRSFTQ